MSEDFKEIEVDGTNYVVRLMPTMEGLDFMTRMQKEGLSGALVYKAVKDCVAIGSTSFDEKKFNTHFKGKYGHLMRLVEKVVEFNFPDMYEGNEESDSEEE